MTWIEPRYVDKFRYTPIYKLPKIQNQAHEITGDVYFEKLKRMEWAIDRLFSGKRVYESITINITNLGNYSISAIMNNGTISFQKWVSDDFIPTATFELNTIDIDWLEQFLSDGNLDLQERLKIADVVVWPMIERMYRITRFYKIEHLGGYGFDDFMQIEIHWWDWIDRAGTPVNLKYTIINVDGQWIVKKGFTWDPDVRYSISIDDALLIYEKVVIGLENSQNKIEALTYSKEAYNILKKSITYTRNDHK